MECVDASTVIRWEVFGRDEKIWCKSKNFSHR